MELMVRIDASNAAFDGAELHAELARILHSLAAHLALDFDTVTAFSEPLHDSNGNTVGRAELLTLADHAERS